MTSRDTHRILDVLIEHDNCLNVVVENESPELGDCVHQRVRRREETVRVTEALKQTYGSRKLRSTYVLKHEPITEYVGMLRAVSAYHCKGGVDVDGFATVDLRQVRPVVVL